MSSTTETPVLDLQLQCEGGSVLVSRQLLHAATRNASFSGILSRLRDDGPNASSTPMQLAVPLDSPTAWRTVWDLVLSPMPTEPKDMTWADLEACISLAEKYSITPALMACETCIFSKLMQTPKQRHLSNLYISQTPSARVFGYVTEEDGSYYHLGLPFLELLVKANMHRAAVHMAPLYLHLVYDSVAQLKAKRLEMVDVARNHYEPDDRYHFNQYTSCEFNGANHYEYAIDNNCDFLRKLEAEVAQQLTAVRDALRCYSMDLRYLFLNASLEVVEVLAQQT